MEKTGVFQSQHLRPTPSTKIKSANLCPIMTLCMYEIREILCRIASRSPVFNRMRFDCIAVEKGAKIAENRGFSTATQPNHIRLKIGERDAILRKISRISYIQSVIIRQKLADLILVEGAG